MEDIGEKMLQHDLCLKKPNLRYPQTAKLHDQPGHLQNTVADNIQIFFYFSENEMSRLVFSER